MSKSHEVSRRDFVTVVTGILGTIMGAVVGLPAIGYLLSPAVQKQKSEGWVPLGNIEDFPVGLPMLRTFVRTKVNGWEKTANSYGVYVIRGEGDQFQVLSNVCTHLSCRVTWSDADQSYNCPCHDAHFAKDGGIIDGPQPRPLDAYGPDQQKIEAGILYILYKEG